MSNHPPAAVAAQTELQDAITLVRNAMRDGCYAAAPGQMERAERLLAQMFVVEHPADDDEPVTEEWLRGTFGPHLASLPYKRYGLHLATKNNLLIGWFRPIMPLYDCLCINETVVIEQPTRGDVRRLCRALGIELKEHHHG